MKENFSRSSKQPIMRILFIAIAIIFILSALVLWMRLFNVTNKEPILDEYGYRTGYYKDSNYVYVSNVIIEDADPVTFIAFYCNYGKCYAKDKNVVYFGTSTIEYADAKTFTGREAHGWDTNYVYYEGNIILGADPSTFTQVTIYYSMDAQHVYYKSRVIPEADPKTFEAIGDYQYAKDANYVYSYGEVMLGVDPDTFKFEQG